MSRAALDCPCEARDFVVAHVYERPPAGETAFSFSGDGYRRQLLRCAVCGHFVSRHEMERAALYEGGYVDATYRDGLRAAFDRIVALPPDRSDNEGRIARVVAFADEYLDEGADRRSALDVGSGLCVFLRRLKMLGWSCTALDPDSRAVEHARSTAGVAAVRGDYLDTDERLGQFDLVCFNKVLEHVESPVEMLAHSRAHVSERGFVYVEVPDGEAAAADGFEREEFFVEHEHVFTVASLAMAATRAGFVVLRIDRLREPSSKYTLAAFLAPRRR